MNIDIKRFTSALSNTNDLERHLKRLKFLGENSNDMRVAVFGKFNHGKSTLLNTIIGEEHFKVADKRETAEISEYIHNNIIWVDTPGLDADPDGKDDEKAIKGAFEIADLIFLVHSVKAGELDQYEKQLYHDLIRQNENHDKKIFLILTQIDQLEKDDFQQVIATIKKQVPDLVTLSISASRYIKGVKEGKEIFIEKSGMNELFSLIAELPKTFEKLRTQEKSNLLEKIQTALEQERQELITNLRELQKQITSKHDEFKNAVSEYTLQYSI